MADTVDQIRDAMQQINDRMRVVRRDAELTSDQIAKMMNKIDDAMSKTPSPTVAELARPPESKEERETEKLRFAKLVAAMMLEVLEPRLSRMEEQLDAVEVAMRLAVGE